MNPVLKIAFACITLLVSSAAIAQKTGNAGNKTAAAQKARPKFRSMINTYTDSVQITVADAEKAIQTPIVVKDEKNAVYPVTSYQVAYRRLGAVEDEETKKITTQSTLVAKHFTTTPVPESWSKHVIEQLRPDEELIFFDIVVKDAAGKLYFVPNIRIKTK